MAGKTSVNVSLSIREDKTIKLLSWAAMQRFAKKAGDLVYGHTQFEISSPSMGMKWFIDEDKDAGTVKVAVEALTVQINCTSVIYMFKEIDKQSKCFKHVVDHEFKHVKLYKRSVNRSARQLRRSLQREKYPDLKKPLELAIEQGRPFLQRWVDSLNALHQDAMARAATDADTLSNRIHTGTEKRRTGNLCNEFAPTNS